MGQIRSGIGGFLVATLVLTGLVAAPLPVRAATLMGFNENDSGTGSLRSVIAIANLGDTITFASPVRTITLTSGQLTLTKNVTITGPMGGTVTVQRLANNPTRFRIGGVTAAISGLTLTLTNSTVHTNIAPTLYYVAALGGYDFPSGGGIYNDSTLTVTNSTVRDNTARYTDNNGGTAGDGGGIYNDYKVVGNTRIGGILAVTNSTIANNTAGDTGGGLFNYGTLTLTSSTISGNWS